MVSNPIFRALKERRYSRLREKYGLTEFPERYQGLCTTFAMFPMIPVQPSGMFFFAVYQVLAKEISERGNFAARLSPNGDLSSYEDSRSTAESLYNASSRCTTRLSEAFDSARMKCELELMAPAINETFRTLRDDLLPQYHQLANQLAESDEPFKKKSTGFVFGNGQ